MMSLSTSGLSCSLPIIFNLKLLLITITLFHTRCSTYSHCIESRSISSSILSYSWELDGLSPLNTRQALNLCNCVLVIIYQTFDSSNMMDLYVKHDIWFFRASFSLIPIDETVRRSSRLYIAITGNVSNVCVLKYNDMKYDSPEHLPEKPTVRRVSRLYISVTRNV